MNKETREEMNNLKELEKEEQLFIKLNKIFNAIVDLEEMIKQCELKKEIIEAKNKLENANDDFHWKQDRINEMRNYYSDKRNSFNDRW